MYIHGTMVDILQQNRKKTYLQNSEAKVKLLVFKNMHGCIFWVLFWVYRILSGKTQMRKVAEAGRWINFNI